VYWDYFPHRYRSSIETSIHVHDVNAGLQVAGHNGALDWRSTSPTWQQRSMQVQAPHLRGCQDRDRQYQAVCNHDYDVSRQPFKGLLYFEVTQ
jgi:hypothetical protein